MGHGRWAAITRCICLVVVATASAAQMGTARADPVADFYRGKTMRMLIGYGPGGGYDIYGRLVAQFLPKHLPGAPIIVVQNMPGGGSFVAAKYMSEAAPKDGTVLGSLAQTLALDSALAQVSKDGSKAGGRIDVARFSYIGRVVTNIDTGVALPRSGIKSFDDVRAKQFSVGVSGGGSTTVLFPSSLVRYAGAKFKLVRGYSGSTDIQLAMDRGEVDIVGAYGLPGMVVSQPGWIERGEAVILYQASLTRHRLLGGVPTLPELALSDEGRVVLRAAASTGEFGRSILTTPDVPTERLGALRKAFQAMLANPEFIAICEQRRLMIDPGTGEELDALARATLQLPPALLAKVAAMME